MPAIPGALTHPANRLYSTVTTSFSNALADIRENPFLLQAPRISVLAVAYVHATAMIGFASEPLNFSRVFPLPIAHTCRYVGRLEHVIVRALSYGSYTCEIVAMLPLIKTLMYQLPIWAAAKQIDARLSIASGRLVKCALAIFSALSATHGCGDLHPRVANTLFAGTLASSYLTFRNPHSGLILSILAHSLSNSINLLYDRIGWIRDQPVTLELFLAPLVVTALMFCYQQYKKSSDPDTHAAHLKSSICGALAEIKEKPWLMLTLFTGGLAMDTLQAITETVTGSPLNFANILPSPLKGLFYTVGHVGGGIGLIMALNNKTLHTVVTAPIIEELMYRWPLLILFTKIDACSSTLITSSLLGKSLNLTGGHLLKGALAIISALGFVHAHDINPEPRATNDYFTSGLALSYLTLRNPSHGLVVSMLAHSYHNLEASAIQHFCWQAAIAMSGATLAAVCYRLYERYSKSRQPIPPASATADSNVSP